jgi:holo-[acyl-carrier protein] synthase
MAFGMKTGIDIVEVQRIDTLIKTHRDKFLNKVFTEDEQKYCETAANVSEKYAGRFAAKEAIRKALQPFTNASYLPFLDIEILPDEFGLPHVTIDTNISFHHPFSDISISISHERKYAIANAIVQ